MMDDNLGKGVHILYISFWFEKYQNLFKISINGLCLFATNVLSRN